MKTLKQCCVLEKYTFQKYLNIPEQNRIKWMRLNRNEEELHVECFKVSLLDACMPYSWIKCLRFGLRL